MTCAKLEYRFVVADLPFEQEFHSAAGGTPRAEPRVDHSRVVEHDKIATIDKPRKIAEREILEHLPIDMQKPAVHSSLSRRLRDQVGRKLVIEIGKPIAGHQWTPACARAQRRKHAAMTVREWAVAGGEAVGAFYNACASLVQPNFQFIVINGEFGAGP